MNAELSRFRDIVLRRLPLIAAITGVFALIGTALAMVMPPVYRAEALLVMESPQIPGELAASTVNAAATEQLQIIEQRMMTRANLLDMAHRHRLYDGRTRDPGQIVADMRDRTGVRISAGGGQATTVRLHFDASDPATASEVTNAFVTFMLEENVSLRTGIAAQTVDFFRIEMERLSTELERRSALITEFKLSHRDALPENQPFLRERQVALESRLAEIARQRAALEADRDSHVASFERTGRVEVVVEDRYAPFLRRLAALQDELDTAIAADGEQSSRVVGLRGRIAAVERSINAQLAGEGFSGAGGALAVHERQLASIADRLADMEAEAGLARAELAEVNDRLQETMRNAITLDTLERDHQTAREQYAQAMTRAATAQTGDLIEALSRGQRITVIEQAVPPLRPHKPNRRLIAAGGAAMGLALSLALVALLERLDRRIRRPADLSNRLGIVAIASIPYLATPGEAGRQRLRGLAVVLALLGGVPAALYAVHAFYLPLDLVVSNLLSTLGIAQFVQQLRP